MNIMCAQRRFTRVTLARVMDECGLDAKMSLSVSASRGCRVDTQIRAIVSGSRPDGNDLQRVT